MKQSRWTTRAVGCGAWLWLATMAAGSGCYAGAVDPGVDGSGTGDGEDDDTADSSGGDDSDDAAIPLQPLHRLNRLEYDNTVRDLLGTELRPAVAFGPDPEANGFDNMADQLGLSPVLLDAYEEAAFAVIADAIDERPAFSSRFASTEIGAAGGYPVGELWALTGNVASVEVVVPEGGDYELVLTAGASTIGPAPVPTAALEVNGVVIANLTVMGSAANPEEHVRPITLVPGVHHVRVLPTNFINDAVANTSNNVLVAALTLRSTTITHGPGHERVYVCEPSQAATQDDAAACYRDIITHFAFRAWRRPLLTEEEDSLVQLFAGVRAHGESEDDALRIVMRAVMLSPKFFYRSRTITDADSEQWLDPYVLASRLSYFLWSSMPDARLFAAAADGSLATDEGLSEAVAWMLEDPKAKALVDGFGEQWLSTRHFATSSPSPEVYPAFDEALREAMTQESRLFFGDYLDNGAAVASMLQPDFAYRNDRLAEHYGLPPVGSTAMSRVPAGPQDRRGVLSLSAWLVAHSDSEHSSPIKRGRWLSDRLLCTPVPPPPAGLEIDPVEFGGEQTVREQLEQHRSDPTCAACHSLLDVLGIGLEEFDGVASLLSGPDVDTLGELPDGRSFEGAAALAGLYAEDDTFTGCLTQKLFTYALGRPPRLYDLPHVEEITARMMAEGGDLPRLIDAIVHTPAFRSPAAIEGGE
ncbi:DUF1592 domain-containing protein [Paraliomyxa miuraensis]|uniref:DUF1592 domain-containing protein n=1 Tax=Paraliomyxa miuraensis TaxID=376150 RepID=UPI00224F7AC5|nr:DUF1592 domain-containing protein [Paraliomyxa miuraensis]MCX4240803.1 DUF1592 domain-containing protein [Paraliomyxa miuraensis]